MTMRTIAGALLAICLGLSTSSARALTEPPMRFSALIERANDIVVGTVFDMNSLERFFGDYARVVTDVSLVDLQVVKGETEETEMVVTQLGGQVGDVVEWYPGLPAFEMDRRYLVFLVRTDLDLAVPIGLQGLYVIETDPLRALEVVTSAGGDPVLAVRKDRVEFGVAPDAPEDAGERLAGAMTLEQFLKEIEARLY